MVSLVDCPSCQVLIAADERACPFCGAAPGRVWAAPRLLIGAVLGFSPALMGCDDKTDTATASDTASEAGTANDDTASDAGAR